MKSPFKPGDKKHYSHLVVNEDAAAFASGQVHPVYATFALGRDAEWACRLFVLEMKEEDEEGIGTFLNIRHHSPAIIGEEVLFEAVVKSIEKNEIICTYSARCRERLIASGETGQKILKKTRVQQIFDSLV